MHRRNTSRIAGIPIARDGWRFVAPALAAALLFAVFTWFYAAGFFLLLAVVVGAFFRDPERKVPRQPGLLLAPADGKIVGIDEVEMTLPDGETRTMRRVTIFLSVLNAHIQRAPTMGKVEEVRYFPGKFLNALSDKSSDENEHNMIWMTTPLGPVGVKQIAGLIARRVLCWVEPETRVLAGERIGLIRFGSRTEAYLPMRAVVRTETGRNVKAGISILAEASVEDAGETGSDD